ncbi:Serine/threonine kinase, partial [Physocladia obscura]
MRPGARVEKCSECGKCAHSGCKPMVPNFCKLTPEMAIKLVSAFEEAEKRKHAKELEEVERAEKVRRRENGEDEAAAAAVAAAAAANHQATVTDVLATAQAFQTIHLNEIAKQDIIDAAKKAQKEATAAAIAKAAASAASASAAKTTPASFNIPEAVHKNIKLQDFEFLSVLGRGAFGKVMLIEEKATKQLYAMKALKKEFIIKSDDVASAKLEKRIFQKASESQHPFLVNLHSCFQTDSRLYFVMEYVCGGDLMCHIQERKRFSQVRAKFYACEVLLALEFFHKNNIVYRDLKLDNILMCPDGHIKVADYGICKENMPYGMFTRTYCGTPDYMAPEILSQNKYTRAVDWWSFGILIYVMLVGRYPFHGDDENDILEAILNDAIEYPSNMPKDTLSLIQGLLKKDPRSRLGGGRGGADEVKRHPYFHG